jgi:hypothetical protein
VLTVVIFVLVVIYSALAAYRQEEKDSLRKKKEEKKRAEERIATALTETGVANLFAFGNFNGAPATDPSDLQVELVQGETLKWAALNAGRLLGRALVGCGSASTRFAEDGSAHLDLAPGKGTGFDFSLTMDCGPYTPKDFQISRPNPDTAILHYKVESGWIVADATTVWAKRDGRWVTAAYQVTRA